MTNLLLLLMSCVSVKENPKVLPDIVFPDFPINVTDESIVFSTIDKEYIKICWTKENKEVVLPYWFYEMFVKYDVAVSAAEEKYLYLKKTYE